MNWLIGKRVFVSCILAITLRATQTIIAVYQPPPDQKSPSGYTDTSGTRLK